MYYTSITKTLKKKKKKNLYLKFNNYYFFSLFGGVVVVLLYLFMTVIQLNLILKCSVLILKFSNVVHIHNKKLKRVYI